MGTLRPEYPTIWAHGALGIAKATRSKKEAGGKEVAAQVGCLGFGALGRFRFAFKGVTKYVLGHQ